MATSLTNYNWIKIYKDLLRAAQKFPQYNYREFAKRRIRDYFEHNRNLKDEKILTELYQEAQRNLDVINRQTLISKLYPTENLIIESKT